MSYRYLRHGLLTRRTKFDKNGFKPFIDNLMWTITEFHYKHYLKNTITKNILENQLEIEKIAKSLINKDFLFLRTAHPQIIPFVKQTNPFCPNSWNKSGFNFFFKNFDKYPKPWKNRKLAITDLDVPKYPKHH